MCAHLPATEIVDALATQSHDARRRLNELQDGFAGGGFAAAAFPDQSQRFTLADRKRDAVDRVDPCGFAAEDAAPYREMLFQLRNL